MDVPKSFKPEYGIDEKTEQLKEGAKLVKERMIEHLYSLLELSKIPKNYYKKRSGLLQRRIWELYFKESLLEHIIRIGTTEYQKQDHAYFTSVLVLEFSDKQDLERSINQIDIYSNFKDSLWNLEVVFLKKDKYITVISLNRDVADDLEAFKERYVEEFGMEMIT